MIARGKQVGVYALYCSRAKDEFTAGEIDLLGVLASQATIAIENSRLYTDLEATHTQLKDSQHQIMLSAKFAAIGELAGGVAHEVNNPLQIILSRVQLMTLQNKDDAKVVKGLNLIEHNVKRISRIIRALLGFAGHNAQESGWEEFDVAQALRQALALVGHQLEKGLIETSFECEPELPLLTGNIGELEQVFINLIINAQNAMADGGALNIEVRREGEQLEVRFADTGCGIAPKHLDRIFEPFYTTRADEGGTGLGLAISYRIVERHQGKLTVESTLGKGTTFFIRLPLSAVEMKAEQ
jgi:signal transduction histidine kinase